MRQKVTRPDVLIRLARINETSIISSLFFEWLKFGDERGRIKQIRKAIRAKEILVSVEPKTRKIIGFIHAVTRNDPISSGPTLYIAAFYVQEQFRQRGIGTIMLRHIIARAIIQGAVAIEVATAQRPAFRLYKKFGFSQYRADIGEVLLGLNLKKFKTKAKKGKRLGKVN